MVQNIDFSRKVGSSAREGRAVPDAGAGISRLVGWGLAGAILIFTGGIIAGLKIADLRSIERNVVKYPDGRKARSFANVGDRETEPSQRTEQTDRTDRSEPSDRTDDGQDGLRSSNRPGRADDRPAALIIRIGAFRPARAGELARSLNAIPELAKLPYHSCRGISDLNPSRSHVFPVPADDRKTHRLFAGCYTTQDEARQALDILTHTGVAALKDAKVYELSE